MESNQRPPLTSFKGEESWRRIKAKKAKLEQSLREMEALLSQFSVLASEALDDKSFDPARIERLLGLFEREALSSWSAAEAEHRREEQEAESSMKEAEGYLNSLLDAAMGDFNRSYDEVERSSEKELRGLVGSADAAQRMGQVVASAAGGASEKYMDAALGSAMATVKSAFAAAAKINKVHPS